MTGPIKIDFSSVQDFDLIPEGNYAAVITQQEIRESQSSEYPYINWTLTLDGGEFNDRKQWVMTSLSPKAAFRLKEFLIAVGETKESLSGEFELDPEKYVGKRLVIQIVHEKYEGNNRDRVKSVFPEGGAPLGPKGSAAAASNSGGDKPKSRRL